MKSEPPQSPALTGAQTLLAEAAGHGPYSEAQLADLCVRLAAHLQQLAIELHDDADRERSRLLARMMDDRSGQLFTTELTDRAHRSREASRVVEQARLLLEHHGTPEFLEPLDRVQLSALRSVGQLVPGLAARAVVERIHRESSQYVLPDDPEQLASHLQQRRDEGVRVNVNPLGEAVLGEEEARRHLDKYVSLLARPDVDTISLKISSIYSQINLVAWEHTVRAISERLRTVFRAAMAHSPQSEERLHKLVYLDMEAYDDLQLTRAAYQAVLGEEEFRHLTAGIVLQAYIPDSVALQRELVAWARKRVDAGGAPIRVRIVKGANLGMERVSSSLHGWPLPVYPSKRDVDANYKRMVEFACQGGVARVAKFGIASHNVFELAFGMVMRAMHHVENDVEFELLEGMANPLRRAVQQVAGRVLLYGPVVGEAEFQSAVAYLVRRLDENTAEQNFLRHSFGMRVGDAAWESQKQAFLDALAMRNVVSDASRRVQNRREPPAAPSATGPFGNEPDTDFSLAANRQWLVDAIAAVRASSPRVSPCIAGETIERPEASGFDPSRPGVEAYRIGNANADDIERCLAFAPRGAAPWAARSVSDRAGVLRCVAHELRRARGQLVATMMLDAGKRAVEADVEVSEAVDFAEYYARSIESLDAEPGVEVAPKGVVLVTPPWNFPLAIPVGGVLAALAAGNGVIFKPAPETVLTAALAADLCWKAGVPKDALQFVPCGDDVASALVKSERVDAVVLTGGSATARLFHELRPGIDLMAETGGKNCIVVSAMADREQAVKDIVQSAFGHAGQKCSACSVVICEAEVYEDATFRRQLRDATTSLAVGSAWDPESFVTPLIHPPRGALLHAIEHLDDGEEWLVEPRIDASNPRLVSPGIKLGVQPQSAGHLTELFGPVLSVMRADDLADAVRLANSSEYGLTAGLQSLDEREQRTFVDAILAGNVYVNRGITGAIVHRQPFGGMKASCFGPGAKAGGPNYVAQLCRLSAADVTPADEPLCSTGRRLLGVAERVLSESQRRVFATSAGSYADGVERYFAHPVVTAELVGQDNVLRYLPCRRVAIAVGPGGQVLDVLRSALAAHLVRCPVDLFVLPGADVPPDVEELFRGEVVRSLEPLMRAVRDGRYERVRALGVAPRELLPVAAKHAVHVAPVPVLGSGRRELLHYVREQSLSVSYHRYGSLGERTPQK